MVNMTAYTDGDGKWYFDDVAVTPGTTYNFSDYYKSTGPSLVVVRYTDGAGAFTYVQIGAPAITSQWQQFSGNFTPPAGTVSVTVFHLLNGIGTLWVDKFSLTPGAGTTPDPAAFDKGYVSLTFDDGWNSQYLNARSKLNTAGLKATFYIISQEMFNAEQTNNTDPNEYVNVAQVQQLQADGHEISAHTRTHASLISLSPQQLISEVQGSRTDLQSVGIQPSDTFAYPYGDYSTSVIQAVKNAGYVGARSVEGGFNTKTSDKFVLKTLSAEIGTPLQEIKNAIDAAAANKVWLTLMFHNVDNTGSQYSTTPESLQQIIDYIKQKNIAVITVHEGVQKMQ